MMDARLDELRRSVAFGCRVLAGQGHGDLVWGHVSTRDPGGAGVWIKRAGVGFDEVGAEDTILVTPEGDVVQGEGRRHVEYPIHTEIAMSREDIGAVVHTHAPHAVALGALDTPLLPISHEGTLFVPPDIARFTTTGDLILTAELGRAVAACLGDRNAVLLVNHGIVTVGPDVPTAVMTAILLERACGMQLTAMAAGTVVRSSDDGEALAKRSHCYPAEQLQLAWDYLVRSLGDSSEGGLPG